MNARDRQRPQTGLPSWEHARWSTWPGVSHVVPMSDGFGFLCQHASPRQHDGVIEVDVPPATQHVLLAWRRHARMEVGLGGALRSRSFDRYGSMVVPHGAPSRWIIGAAGVDQCFHLHFDEPAVRETASREDIPPHGFGDHVSESGDPALARLVDLAMAEAGQDGRPSALAWQSLATLVHLHILRGQAAAAGRATGGLSGWQLRRVFDHMRDNLADDVSLVELATIARLSPYHFCRAFKQSTGVPPHRWLQMQRVERAKELLATGKTSVIEAAGAVGYDNPGHFARLFKRETGVTPREFKRQFM